jgi:hypothetical protein
MKILDQRSDRAERKVAAEDGSDLLLLFDDDELLAMLKDCVTETKEASCFVERLDQLGEVGKRTGQAIDFVERFRKASHTVT